MYAIRSYYERREPLGRGVRLGGDPAGADGEVRLDRGKRRGERPRARGRRGGEACGQPGGEPRNR